VTIKIPNTSCGQTERWYFWVQTGTVHTMLYNIHLYNAGEREVEQDNSSYSYFVKGYFDLAAKEWINGENQGRKFVGEQAKEYQNKQSSTD
jgi:hypothetical protein